MATGFSTASARSHRGVDAVLDTFGRGEIPLSNVLAGGAERVLTLVAVNAAAAAVQVYAGGAGSELRPALREIACPIEQGRLTVPIWPTFPLTQSAVRLHASNLATSMSKSSLCPKPMQAMLVRPCACAYPPLQRLSKESSEVGVHRCVESHGISNSKRPAVIAACRVPTTANDQRRARRWDLMAHLDAI